MQPDEIKLFLAETLAGRYRPASHLGSGAFSGAFLTSDQRTGGEVATKILKLTRCSDHDARREFQDEVSLLERLKDCDRVIDLLDSGQHTVNLRHPTTGGSFPLVTEYAVLELAAGSLADLILYGEAFTWPDRLRLYRDVVKGVHQMHLARIVHRDVKAENALVNEQQQIAKIADLGRAHDTTQPPRFAIEAYLLGRGDPRFAPFEFLWLQGTVDPDEQARADVFLLGALLFETATGIALTPLVTGNPLAVMNASAPLTKGDRTSEWQASIPRLRDAIRPALEDFARAVPPVIASRAVALLQQLTEPDPARRLPARAPGGTAAAGPWDLQWLLRRIDGLRRAVDPEFRKQYINSRPRHGRPRSRR
jgi:serine/threonine protein kinase